MSDETSGVSPTPVEPVEQSLDDFSTEFFGRNKEKPDDQPEVVETDDNKPDANKTESQHEEEDLHDDSADETDPAKPKKKNSAQERISELTKKLREAERQRDEAIAPKPKPAPESAKTEAAETAPTPLDLKEDGSEKYPLGEFDPAYIKDLVSHTLKEERAAAKAYEEQTAAQQTLEAQKNALDESWREKLKPAQERYPDFVEKGQALAQVFENINPAYGEYLVATLKSMDYGTDVLYYLANNPDVARKIVEGGPAKATIALGRLEARFDKEDEDPEPEIKVKTTKAPEPPKALNKGTSVGKSTVDDDTDDLDAFSRKFFDKRRK